MDGGNPLAVLLKDLKSAFFEGIKHNVPLPFNALSATELFNAMGKEKPDADQITVDTEKMRNQS